MKLVKCWGKKDQLVSELSGLKVVEVNVYVQDVKIRTEGTSEEEEDTEEGL